MEPACFSTETHVCVWISVSGWWLTAPFAGSSRSLRVLSPFSQRLKSLLVSEGAVQGLICSQGTCRAIQSCLQRGSPLRAPTVQQGSELLSSLSCQADCGNSSSASSAPAAALPGSSKGGSRSGFLKGVVVPHSA